MLTLHGSYRSQPGPFTVLNLGSTNTLVRTGAALWKFYKHRFPGPHPEVEIAKAMGRYLGHATDGDITIAFITPWIDEANSAWELRRELTPDDLAAMGAATYRAHRALHHIWGESAAEATAITSRLIARAEAHTQACPRIAPFLPAAIATYQSLQGRITTQRVHGDLHLGQILQETSGDESRFHIIDFEGEPGADFHERAHTDPPERDLAAMVRSCHYAGLPDTHIKALLDGYGVHNKDALNAYVIDKLLYEIYYESTHRPDWIDIPLIHAATLLEENLP